MADEKAKSVLVGMSGGVDSSVSAALLKERGFRVVGGFIKNWSDTKDVWTGECDWYGERRDAMRVAAKLGIPLFTFDFEEQYRDKVVKELFSGYETGGTPNPDVLCNEAIKFGLFLDEARRLGFDYIATGHYAQVVQDSDGVAHLLRGADSNKDQSYFLYRVPQEALRQSIFPIGDLKKDEVRKIAQELELPVAEKPDSQGICFIGKLDMGEFLRKKIPSRPGDIVDPDGKILGQHDGLDQYTIGQRQGMGLDEGGHSWYVADKDLEKDRLIVVPDSEHPLLFRTKCEVKDLHWSRGAVPDLPMQVAVQVRYRQTPIFATIEKSELGVLVSFDKPVRAVAPGQSAVFYFKDECLGGGIIS
ncbi:tRNA 2-thiouridine(34) synthase MnmA [Patescibacteria group bacterium]|nr:tRNA 2-thiouridine(34) synthase MnmA [Patescibacteria group bacterium]